MGSAIGIAVLVLLAGAARTAVVLPRPPSSPNHIPQEYDVLPSGIDISKNYIGEKGMYQSANVGEKPDTQDYRFVEIEVRDADNGRPLDVRGLVRAVLDTEMQHRQDDEPLALPNQPAPRRFDEAGLEPESDSAFEEAPLDANNPMNASWPHPEVVPHSIFGVRDVGLGPIFTARQQQYQLQLLAAQQQQQRHKLDGLSETDEKLYYLKGAARPKVYVNFRGGSGDARHHQLREPASPESRLTLRLEPAAAFLRATQPYRSIPAPPSRIPSRPSIAHTTPVQRYTARRTDILPGYAFSDA
ncbi:hypothetical protein QAD02_014863 [Eretmocerus hayati]|uniref:Uncharacterized protein n=1 Tax=Eretmocerus hayati TaxID=131215 RepID=A0ACC2P876_9HYME|nr:hypothetical protein QAD02_014863 [Eretmocerus hayati]